MHPGQPDHARQIRERDRRSRASAPEPRPGRHSSPRSPPRPAARSTPAASGLRPACRSSTRANTRATRTQNGHIRPANRGHSRSSRSGSNRRICRSETSLTGRSWSRITPSGVTRNEGVRGSSPRVGSRDLQGFSESAVKGSSPRGHKTDTSGDAIWAREARIRSPLRGRSHKGDHGNSWLMSPRAEMHGAAGSVRAEGHISRAELAMRACRA
jgi:hypothetical protein